MDMKLLIFDACRDNPFGRSWTWSLSRGLAQMGTVQETLIAYATGTGPGPMAAAGQSQNSPYTAQVLEHLATPGRHVEMAFKAVRLDVQSEPFSSPAGASTWMSVGPGLITPITDIESALIAGQAAISLLTTSLTARDGRGRCGGHTGGRRRASRCRGSAFPHP